MIKRLGKKDIFVLEKRGPLLRNSLVLGFPNGGGRVSAPLLIMDNHGCTVFGIGKQFN